MVTINNSIIAGASYFNISISECYPSRPEMFERFSIYNISKVVAVSYIFTFP